MYYVLTEEEYKTLFDDISTKVQQERSEYNKIIQYLCTEVADNKKILFWGNLEPKVWGCILSDNSICGGYCDECPVQDVCPHENKVWSK